MKWRDAALTLGMWILFGWLFQRQFRLVQATYQDVRATWRHSSRGCRRIASGDPADRAAGRCREVHRAPAAAQLAAARAGAARAGRRGAACGLDEAALAAAATCGSPWCTSKPEADSGSNGGRPPSLETDRRHGAGGRTYWRSSLPVWSINRSAPRVTHAGFRRPAGWWTSDAGDCIFTIVALQSPKRLTYGPSSMLASRRRLSVGSKSRHGSPSSRAPSATTDPVWRGAIARTRR